MYIFQGLRGGRGAAALNFMSCEGAYMKSLYEKLGEMLMPEVFKGTMRIWTSSQAEEGQIKFLF